MPLYCATSVNLSRRRACRSCLPTTPLRGLRRIQIAGAAVAADRYPAAVAVWEFSYVDLWLGEDKSIGAVHQAQQQIAALGRDGWEPVGTVYFQYREPNKVLGANTSVVQLMFKRPASA